MNAVSPVELANRVLELLGIEPGQTLDLAKLRDGSILLRKASEDVSTR